MSDAPIFEHPEYTRMKLLWDKAADVYSGLSTRDLKSIYLPRWGGEEENSVNDPYIQRLDMTDLENHFRFSINGLAGLLSSFSLLDTLPSLKAVEENVDLKGNDFRTFLLQQDIWALRDLASVVLVELAERIIPEGATANDVDDPRPFLSAFPLRNVINWREEIIDGVMTLTLLVIRRTLWKPIGDYGQQEIKEYIVHRPGSVEIWEQPRDPESGKLGDAEFSRRADMLDANGEPLRQIPYVWYSSVPMPPLQFQVEEDVYMSPPLESLLNLNLSHLRAWSEFLSVRHKTNIPVPVLESDQEITDGLKLGGGHYVHVEKGGKFYFAEPTGAAMNTTLESIKKTEQAMELASLAFLVNSDSPGNQTATEANLQSARGRSGLQVMADLKKSACQQIGRHWLRYTDPEWENKIESLPEIIDLNTDALVSPTTMADMKSLSDIRMTGDLTTYEFRKQLQHTGIMYEGFSAEELDYGPNEDRQPITSNQVVELVADVAELPLPAATMEDLDDDEEILG